MYIAKTDFEKVLLWYERSRYKAMLIFCSGFNPKDREITKLVAYNKDYIDRTTGEGVCYLFFDALEDTFDLENNMSDIHHVAGIQNIYRESSHNANIKVTEDICKQFDILSSDLPALILIRNREKADVFPIESYANIETFIYASRLLGDCFCALDGVNKELSVLKSSVSNEKWKISNMHESLERINQEIDNKQTSINETRCSITKCHSVLEDLQNNGYNVLNEIVTKIHDAVVELINCMVARVPKESYMSELYTSPDKYKYFIDYYGLSQDQAIVEICNHIQEHLDIWDICTGVRISKYMPHPSNKEYEKRLNDCLVKAIERLTFKIESLNLAIENEEEQIIKLKSEAEELKSSLKVAKDSLPLFQKDNEANQQILTEEIEQIITAYAHKASKDLFLDETLMKNIYLELTSHLKGSFSNALSKMFYSVHERNIPFNRKLQELKSNIEAHDFDIYISCKSEDYDSANELFVFLEENGFKPFLAAPYMRELGYDLFDDTIREVIGICDTMIVFATDEAYLSAPKVHEEWSIFSNEISTGRKNGKLLTVVSPRIRPDDLPIGLRHLECFTTETYKDALIPYLLDKTDKSYNDRIPLDNPTQYKSSNRFIAFIQRYLNRNDKK